MRPSTTSWPGGRPIEPRRLLALLQKFRQRRLLVIGDLILDRFIWGEVERISPEAPVPVLRVTGESYRPGGAANVVQNVRALGGEVTVCGVVGRDAAGRRLLRELRSAGAVTAGVFAGRRLQTTQKSRVIASPRHQQIVRLDRENSGEIGGEIKARLERFVARQAPAHDAVVVSDYGKGVIHAELLELLGEMASRRGLLWIVDPKEENFNRYRRASLVTPNKEEASQASGVRIRDEASLQEAGRRLLGLWEAKAVLITRGPEGMSLFHRDGWTGYFPTSAREVFDVTGAGDTVVATCALALASGGSFEEAAVLANYAAGIAVGELGTFAVPRERLKAAIEDGLARGRSARSHARSGRGFRDTGEGR
jgi:rfaE bifunctional protein kinase chain/domain